ncbi:MAG: ABC transporter ATP-binding protein [Pseudomonadales bacterium]|nr:ABC transporter ATP-binding protein [Pseudomonadales bacterium]
MVRPVPVVPSSYLQAPAELPADGARPVSEALFEARDLSVSFGGIKAVRDVSFAVHAGEVFSIIGPNGAGKTTIFNLVSRFYETESGSMTFDGVEITNVPPHRTAQLGIARTFQNTELFEHETVLTNLLIAHHVHRRTNLVTDLLFLPGARRQELDFRRRVEDVIDLLDLQGYREQPIGGLPYGARKMVEIARALCLEPKLLLLDEPSSGLNPEETEDLSFWIEDIVADLGITVAMVEHDMNLVATVSNRVLAMADGAVLATGDPTEIQNHPDVLRAYLGD